MKLHIIQHESFEAPGAIADWAEHRGYQINYSRVYLYDPLPSRIDQFDLLVVMGGPQSPATTLEECPHFDAYAEIDLIRRAIHAGKAVLGVCLGAQLIGEALGAPFEHSPNREIGVFQVELTEPSRLDPFFSQLPAKFLVGHWHGDMPGLTDTSQVLAYSAGCPRQIVKYSPRVYGFQCHFEFTSKTIEGMLTHCAAEIESHKNLPYIQSPSDLRAANFQEMNETLFKFLDYIISTTRISS